MPHTPGPWTAKHIAGSNFAVQEFSIRGAFDETPHVYPIFNKDRSAIDGTTVFCSPEDAHLIAAAPELLEALNGIKRALANSALHCLQVEYSAEIAAVDAAIAKTTVR